MKTKTDNDILLECVKRIHMIGIGGSGMCPLAEILHSKGYNLSGSDNNTGDPLKRIEALGIPVTMGHSAENIVGAELIVYSAAISDDNPELVAARAQGIPTLERSFLLGAVTRQFDDVIGVCGTHGKTTATSMITQILYLSDLDPTAVIGGKLPLTNSNGLAGSSSYMVCESCEYVDTFLKLSPDIAVLLNIDNDHMEYFKTMDNLVASFKKFCDMAGKCVVVNGDDEFCLKATQAAEERRITFGLDKKNDYYAENIVAKEKGMEFDMMKSGALVKRISIQAPGQHNVYNALAAAVTAIYIGVEPKNIAMALSTFSGAGRRFEIICEQDGLLIADDYAHHPTELSATLNAAQNMERKGEVIAVFQPFTFSRTAMLKDEFIEALKIADRVILTPIMGSREHNTFDIKSQDITEKLQNAVVIDTFEELAAHVCETAKSGDLVITMGGGDIYKAAYMMRDLLTK